MFVTQIRENKGTISTYADYGGETDLLFVTLDAVRQNSGTRARMKNDELIS